MYVLYLKDSEHIEDTLTYMGAQQCTIELMNIKIRKDMRNRANRIRNCDEANIDKVVSAAMRQTEDILWIIRCNRMETLPEELRSWHSFGWKIREHQPERTGGDASPFPSGVPASTTAFKKSQQLRRS